MRLVADCDKGCDVEPTIQWTLTASVGDTEEVLPGWQQYATGTYLEDTRIGQIPVKFCRIKQKHKISECRWRLLISVEMTPCHFFFKFCFE